MAAVMTGCLLAAGCQTLRDIKGFADDPLGTSLKVAVDAVDSGVEIEKIKAELNAVVNDIVSLFREHGSSCVIDGRTFATLLLRCSRLGKRIAKLADGGLGTTAVVAANLDDLATCIGNLTGLLKRSGDSVTAGELVAVVRPELLEGSRAGPSPSPAVARPSSGPAVPKDEWGAAGGDAPRVPATPGAPVAGESGPGVEQRVFVAPLFVEGGFGAKAASVFCDVIQKELAGRGYRVVPAEEVASYLEVSGIAGVKSSDELITASKVVDVATALGGTVRLTPDEEVEIELWLVCDEGAVRSSRTRKTGRRKVLLALRELTCELADARQGAATAAGTPAATDRSDMLVVEAGDFFRGCHDAVDQDCDGDESPGYWVRLAEFEIDESEVTVEDYAACVKEGACEEPVLDAKLCNWGKEDRARHPVNCVDWHQAERYCAWAGKRLCTEAEWEKAARGAEVHKYPWGQEAADCEHAVMKDAGGIGCGEGGTRPVGSRRSGASPCGALDMAGNVWEWVADWYHPDHYARSISIVDPPGPRHGEKKVVRGGSFGNDAASLRVSNRKAADPATRTYVTGFRCCRTRQMRKPAQPRR